MKGLTIVTNSYYELPEECVGDRFIKRRDSLAPLKRVTAKVKLVKELKDTSSRVFWFEMLKSIEEQYDDIFADNIPDLENEKACFYFSNDYLNPFKKFLDEAKKLTDKDFIAVFQKMEFKIFTEKKSLMNDKYLDGIVYLIVDDITKLSEEKEDKLVYLVDTKDKFDYFNSNINDILLTLNDLNSTSLIVVFIYSEFIGEETYTTDNGNIMIIDNYSKIYLYNINKE